MKKQKTVKSKIFYLAIFLFLLFSCVSSPPKAFLLKNAKKIQEADFYCLPASVKILENQVPTNGFSKQIEIHSAIREAESRQILISAGKDGLKNVNAIFSWDQNQDEEALSCIDINLEILGYSPVKKPGLRSFGKIAPFPDPVMPLSTFSIEKNKNRILFLTAGTNPGAQAGTYKGRISINIETNSTKTETWSIPVSLQIYPVELPKTSFLKTIFYYYFDTVNEERYYDGAWTDEMAHEMYLKALDFRFTVPPKIKWIENAKTRNWESLDEQIESWLNKGVTAIEIPVSFNRKTSLEELEQKHLPPLAILEEHLIEKGWLDYCYIYYFDEPSLKNIKPIKAQLQTIRKAIPNFNIIYTYGVNRRGEKEFVDLIDVWMPNIHQYKEKFALERQKQGDEVWIYTCIGNIHRQYPDSFRIDWYGASHRVLGPWMFFHNIDGYLYWRIDRWITNPWENAETFPWANGDGIMFYPNPDKKSLPLASLRLHAMRDSFEDFDLLTMLKKKSEARGKATDAEKNLLSVKELTDGKVWFDRDDNAYDEFHKKLLEALASPF